VNPKIQNNKLTDSDVAQIRDLIDYRNELREKYSAVTNVALAEKFSVSASQIERISRFNAWHHV